MLENKSIIDESLDLNNTKINELSILISESGLSFLVLDIQTKKIMAWKRTFLHENIDIQERCFYISNSLKKEPLLSPTYSKVKVVYASSDSVLVPTAFYDKDKERSLYDLSLDLDTKESICKNSIRSIEAEKLFAMPNCIQDALNNHFDKFIILHHTSVILENVYVGKQLDSVWVYCSASFFTITVFKQEKLILDNAFRYRSKEDALYYLLNTLTRLELNPKTQKIMLYLDINQKDELIDFLSDYLGNIQYPVYPKEYIYSHQFTSDFSSFLTLHINSFKCE